MGNPTNVQWFDDSFHLSQSVQLAKPEKGFPFETTDDYLITVSSHK